MTEFLLVHGAFHGAWCWRKTVAELQKRGHRAKAIDLPGQGEDRTPLKDVTLDTMVDKIIAEMANLPGKVVLVGHSLGAYLAVALASDPPVELRAVVLIDGGYLRVDEMVELGQPPVSASRSELVAWLSRHRLRFRDWDTAIQEIAAMFDSSVTPALEAYLREVLVEVNGEVRDPRSPERMADLLVAARSRDTPALAHQIAVPTLLIACAKQPEHRELRQTAWQRFADASPQIQLHVAETWSHNPIMEAPVASANLIADWLRAHL